MGTTKGVAVMGRPVTFRKSRRAAPMIEVQVIGRARDGHKPYVSARIAGPTGNDVWGTVSDPRTLERLANEILDALDIAR
jgi:hypothetical protein